MEKKKQITEYDKISITDIVPSIYNPRKISNNEYNKLSNSLSEFGVISPIIINLNNNHIIGGHMRYDVLYDEYLDNEDYEELNLIRLGDIGWVFPSTDLKVEGLNEEKAMNLALNKISGEWDIPKLENLLIDLDVDEYDLELTGFDNLDLKEYNLDLKRNIDLETPQEKLKKTLEKEQESESNNTKIENVKENTYNTTNTNNHKEKNEDNIPNDEPSFDESIADDIPTIQCPRCGYEIPK